MTSQVAPLSPRDALLRRVGRNVVNFQYLEATLRNMIPSLHTEGTPRDIQSRLDATARRYKKSSLGDLADVFIGTVLPKHKADDCDAAEITDEFSIRQSVTIEATPDVAAQHRRELLKLVVERNRLVHRDLLSVDLDSQEQCEQLSERLDEQNDRIRKHLADLNSLREAHLEALTHFSRYIESAEFMSALGGKCNDA